MLWALTPSAGRSRIPLVLTEGWRQELHEGGAVGLAPPPDLAGLQRRHRLELQLSEDLAQRRRHAVAQNDRQPLEARDIDVVGHGRLIEADPHAELAFVEPEGLRADQRAPQAEDADASHGRDRLSGLGVRQYHIALGAQHAHQTRALPLVRLQVLCDLGIARRGAHEALGVSSPM